jgi:gliding motility-associated protein GldM
VKTLSAQLENFIDSLECEFIAKISKDEVEVSTDIKNPKAKRKILIKNPDGTVIHDSVKAALQLGGFSWMEKGLDDTHEAPKFFLTGVSTGGIAYGPVLKEKVIAYRQEVKKILGEDSAKVNFPFDVEKTFLNKDGKEVSWEEKNFDEVVAGAGLVTLTRMKAEAMNAEFDAVNTLYKQVTKGEVSFDNFMLISRPKSAYVIQGGTYETHIYLGAYDTKKDFEAVVNGQRMTSKGGIITYTAHCPTPGPKKVTATALIKSPDGREIEAKLTDEEYFVAPPAGSIQLDNMMVVYAGIDNPVTISGAGVANKDITPTITPSGAATITKSGQGDDKYIIKPAAGGKTKNIEVTLRAKIDGKEHNLATTKVKVREIPKPEIKVNGTVNNGTLNKKSLAQSAQITLDMGKDFLLKIDRKQLRIVRMQVYVGRKPYTIEGRQFTPEVLNAIKGASSGDQLTIVADVSMPDGNVTHPSFIAKLK